MNISDMLESQAAALGNAPAIILQDRTLTFKELDTRVWQLHQLIVSFDHHRGAIQ